MTTRKCSSAVPLTLVPALAAVVGCGGPQTVSGVDPCLPQVYNEALCQTAVRIHASNGYSTEYPVERFYRDAPLMVVGEGTNEIQRSIIARQLVERGRLPYT